MKLKAYPYELKLKYPFGISHNVRTFTPIVLVELEHQGIIGFGEASLPPYLPETQQSVLEFLNALDFSAFSNPVEQMDDILDYVIAFKDKNNHAKASVDIALHDLVCKILGVPLNKFLKTDHLPLPVNSCTIGIDTLEVTAKKVAEAVDYSYLKVKLGTPHDFETIKTIRQLTDKPLYADANQGWKDPVLAKDTIDFLYENKVLVIEQPMPITMKKEMEWLTANSKIPLIADESFQTIQDLNEVSNLFHGVNIKLMKCMGLREAKKISALAKQKNLKTMLGCMNESSCANMAGAHIASECNWVDLDGPFLITNDPFCGFSMKEGKIQLTDKAGLGVNINC